MDNAQKNFLSEPYNTHTQTVRYIKTNSLLDSTHAMTYLVSCWLRKADLYFCSCMNDGSITKAARKYFSKVVADASSNACFNYSTQFLKMHSHLHSSEEFNL